MPKRAFSWLWAAYAVSVYGSWLGFGAFSVIAITVLHAGAAQVAAMSSAGLAIGALLSVPLGPWMEFRAKRPVMIAMDVVRFAAMASVPLAYWAGVLTFAQLLVVSTVVAAAKIAFTAASGAYLRTIVPDDGLLVATSRFESTNWSASIVGPPLGGAAIGLLGPVVTVVADAVSYLLSALGITAIRQPEQRRAVPFVTNPTTATAVRLAKQGLPAARGLPTFSRIRNPETAHRWRDLAEGWRYLLTHATLRRFYFNSMLVNGLIMAGEPLLSVLLLSRLKFPVWQYGLAFSVPCIAGLIGSRIARRVVARYGEWTVLRVFGVLRACWPLGLALIQPGPAGLLTVMVTEFGLIFCAGVYAPVSATYRLTNTEPDCQARVLAAWSTGTSLSIAVLTALWGLLAQVTSPRVALAVAGLLLLGTPFLLPRRSHVPDRVVTS